MYPHVSSAQRTRASSSFSAGSMKMNETINTSVALGNRRIVSRIREMSWDICDSRRRAGTRRSQPRDQQLALEDHFLRQVAGELQEQFLLAEDLGLEVFDVDVLDLFELVAGNGEPFEVDVLRAGHPAEDRFL